MAYNLLDLRTRVRAKIKDSAYPQDTIDGFIYDAIVEIAELYPFKYFEKRRDYVSSVGATTYSHLPDHETTNTLIIVDPDTLKASNITRYYIPSEEFFDVYANYSTNQQGMPESWTEYGGVIYFNRPLNKAYTIRELYQKIPDELTDVNAVPEVPISFRELIVLGAAYRCEEERGNDDIAAIRQNRFNDRMGDMILRQSNDTLTGPDAIVYPGGR